jgi:DNA-binding response OmpR family regulator
MRVLVVEDDELLAGALRRGLTAEGYAVEVAPDGVDGLHRATEFDYDAMILTSCSPAWTAYGSARSCARRPGTCRF